MSPSLGLVTVRPVFLLVGFQLGLDDPGNSGWVERMGRSVVESAHLVPERQDQQQQCQMRTGNA